MSEDKNSGKGSEEDLDIDFIKSASVESILNGGRNPQEVYCAISAALKSKDARITELEAIASAQNPDATSDVYKALIDARQERIELREKILGVREYLVEMKGGIYAKLDSLGDLVRKECAGACKCKPGSALNSPDYSVEAPKRRAPRKKRAKKPAKAVAPVDSNIDAPSANPNPDAASSPVTTPSVQDNALYSRLDAVDAKLAEISKSSEGWDRKYIDLYKEVLETKAALMAGQLEIRKDIVEFMKIYARGNDFPSHPDSQSYPYNPAQPAEPVQPSPSNPQQPNKDNAENIEDMVNDAPESPDNDSNEASNEYGDPDKLYEDVKAARNKALQTKDANDCKAVVECAIRAIQAGYKDKNRIIYEIATAHLIAGQDEHAHKLFGQLAASKESSEEVVLGAVHNLGYILEKSGDEDACKLRALEPEEHPLLDIIYLAEQASFEHCDAA